MIRKKYYHLLAVLFVCRLFYENANIFYAIVFNAFFFDSEDKDLLSLKEANLCQEIESLDSKLTCYKK